MGRVHIAPGARASLVSPTGCVLVVLGLLSQMLGPGDLLSTQGLKAPTHEQFWPYGPSTAQDRSTLRVQELCERGGGHPGLPVLMSLTVSVDVKQQ